MRAAQALFVLVVAAAFVRVAADNASELDDVDLHLRPLWLAAALPTSLLAGPLLPLAWRQVVRATGHDLSAPRAIRSWYLGQTARYLPTGLVAFASRAMLLAPLGVPQAVTLATVAVELLLIVIVGGGLAAAFLPSSELAFPLRVLIASGSGVALLAGPRLLPAASRRVPRLDPHRRGGWSVRDLYLAELGFLANGVAKGLAFVVLASAIQPVGASDVLLLMGTFHAANTLGTVGITPAGLGVREGAVAALLAARYGLGDAAAIAVVARVWDTGIELLWLAAVHHRWFRSRGAE